MMFTTYRSHLLPYLFAVSVMGFTGCSSKEQGAEQETASNAAATNAPAVEKAKEPEYELTLPQGFKYDDLTLPKGENSPLLEVQRLSEAHVIQDPWTKLDRELRALLLVHEDKDYHFILQQQAANEMLRHYLFGHYYQDPTNPQMLEAIGFYTMQLVQAKSVDAELIYKCLRALRETWPKEQIAQVAMATVARVQARPITSVADTATTIGKYRQTYSRALKKMAAKVNG